MDRDFLLCVLAVQTGLATPAQAMAAASGYFADRSRSVRERLLAEGALRPDQLELVGRLVDAALEAHGHDLHKTLPSIGGEGAIFRSFGGSVALDRAGRIGPSRSEPTHGFGSDEEAPDRAESLGDSVDDATRVTAATVGRYELRGADPDAAVIGRGGIGRVLVAFDTHLGREIALKELLAGAEAGSAQLVTASNDRTLRLWDARTFDLVAVLEGHGGPIADVRFVPGSDRFLTATARGFGTWSSRRTAPRSRPPATMAASCCGT